MTFVITDQPCPCGESSDGYSIDDRGWGRCFSCDKNFPPKGDMMTDDTEVRVEYKPQRGLSLATVRKWDIATKSAGDQDVAIGFCFPNRS